MKIGILSIGKEWIEGKEENSLSRILSRELELKGHHVQFHLTIPHAKDLEAALKYASEFCRGMVVISGCEEDEEQQVEEKLSAYLNMPLVIDENLQHQILAFYDNLDQQAPPSVPYQSMVFQGARLLHDKHSIGKVLGIEKENQRYIYLNFASPLGSSEKETQKMIHVLDEFLCSENSAYSEKVCEFYFYGVSPEEITEFFQNEKKKNDVYNFLLLEEEGEWVVRLTPKVEHEGIMDQLMKQVREKWPAGYVGPISLSAMLNKLLIKQQLKITAAESLTSGAFMSYLSREPETGSVFEGGMATYSPRVKQKILGVDREIIDKYGVVSSQCAKDMAEKAMDRFDADLAVSLTGVAGPSSLEGKPPGTVWIGFAKKDQKTVAYKFMFPFKRNKNRKMSVLAAANIVRMSLEGVEFPAEWEK